MGDIRVINIEGVDSNMCCGTHVRNLAQLQCIKLLNVEKNKNRQFLNFLVGSRVLKRLQDCFERECEFTAILKYVLSHPYPILVIKNSILTRNNKIFSEFQRRPSIARGSSKENSNQSKIEPKNPLFMSKGIGYP